jgi:hypothetical protein
VPTVDPTVSLVRGKPRSSAASTGPAGVLAVALGVGGEKATSQGFAVSLEVGGDGTGNP